MAVEPLLFGPQVGRDPAVQSHVYELAEEAYRPARPPSSWSWNEFVPVDMRNRWRADMKDGGPAVLSCGLGSAFGEYLVGRGRV